MKQSVIEKFFVAFPAFGHKNFTFYFIGQLISLTGTWLQVVAQGYLVWQMTHSPVLVGLITALGTLPVLLFSLVGGVVVDKFSKKHILYLTNSAAFLFSLTLGILTQFGHITLLEIAILATLLGCVTALDMPARQAFIVEMVGKKDLTSAIALNAGIYNSARVIGPSIAGFLIGLISVGGAFLVNAISFLPVILFLYFITPKLQSQAVHQNLFQAIKGGISYAYAHKEIRNLLLLLTLLSIFGWSHATILPVMAERIFHTNAIGLGFLYGAVGAGALLATIALSAFSRKVSPYVFIFGGNVTFALFIFLFSLTSSFSLGLLFLFFAGFGLIAQAAATNSTIQYLVDDHVRGRVMSIFTLMFIGFSPIGSFQIGFFAEKFGSQTALQINAVILVSTAFFFFITKKPLPKVVQAA